MTDSWITHRGGCHCGAVRFEVQAAADLEVSDCNCSVCTMTGFQHLIVRREQFHLVCGADDLLTYQFNSGTAQHLFCRRCGIKSYYVPRSNPDGYSVNARCIDPSTVRSVRVKAFDGKRWEEHADELRHLTR